MEGHAKTRVTGMRKQLFTGQVPLSSSVTLAGMRVPEMICARIRRTHGSLRWNLQVPTGRGYTCVDGRLRAEVATAIGPYNTKSGLSLALCTAL